METIINQEIQQAITAHKEGKLEEAERLYRKILETQPTHPDVNHNLGGVLYALGELDEAIASCKKAIELKPDYVIAHYNLGVIQKDFGRLDEAEASYKKAIELKPDYVEAHNNLGNLQKDLGRLDEAEASYKKAIELKPDYAQTYYNLGVLLQQLNRPEEAEVSYKKAIELKPDYVEAHDNLNTVLSYKKLLLKISQAKKVAKKNKVNHTNINNLGLGKGLNPNPFISNRTVEAELISNLYKINSTKLSKMKTGPLFGSGRTSNFKLFENDCSIIKTVEKNLINIMSQAVKSEVCIMDSFLNILGAGGGSVPHTHISNFDKMNGLSNQKYSLQYYISVGDQNCSEPGVFKLKDPDEEILPSDGMVIIIPSSRSHSAVYGGKTDRVMIGVNFYKLI